MKPYLCFCVLASALVLSSCSMDKLFSEEDSNSDERSKSYWTLAESESFVDDGNNGGIFYDDSSSSSSSEDESEIDVFLASNNDEIIGNDYGQINNLCTKMCNILAKISHGKDTDSISEYVINSDLESYLIYEFTNLPSRLNESSTMAFNISNYEIIDGFAFVSGAYQNDEYGVGPFVFIIENVEGRLVVNDLICMVMDYADLSYRSDMIDSPAADFWKDSANCSDLMSAIGQELS